MAIKLTIDMSILAESWNIDENINRTITRE